MKNIVIYALVLIFWFSSAVVLAEEKNLDSPVFRINFEIGTSNLIFLNKTEGDTLYEYVVFDFIPVFGFDSKFIIKEFIFMEAKGSLSYGKVIFALSYDANAFIYNVNFMIGPRFKIIKNETSEIQKPVFLIPFVGLGKFYKEYSIPDGEWNSITILENNYINTGFIIENFKIKNEKISSSFTFHAGIIFPLSIIHNSIQNNNHIGVKYSDKRNGDGGLGIELEICKMFYVNKLGLGFRLFLTEIMHNEFSYDYEYSEGEKISITDQKKQIWQTGIGFIIGF